MIYAPHVVYEYRVGGVRYQAERLHLGPAILSSEAGDAEKDAERYPVGSEVVVYYDPTDPVEATLTPQAGCGVRIYWIVVFILLVMFIAVTALILNSPPII